MTKPTLGYPSRTAAILAMRKQGLSQREIADRLGIDTKNVSALEASAGRKKKRSESGREDPGRVVLFPDKLLAALARDAARRNMHPNRLARLIVETVVREKMIDAVLDDGEEMEDAA